MTIEQLTRLAARGESNSQSKMFLSRLHELLAPMAHWTRNAQTQADVKTRILDWLYEFLPRPPFTDSETDLLAKRVYGYVWQRSQAGGFAEEAALPRNH